jgi:hypothetical protein
VIDGLWTVQFHGPQGVGGGVVVLTRGHVLGGDSGFAYTGSYEVKENMLTGKVSVKNFDPSVANVLGIVGNFDLLLEGKVQGNSIVGTGALAIAPSARVVVRLTKHSDFPA